MSAPDPALIKQTMKAVEPFKDGGIPFEEKHFNRPPIKFLSLTVGAVSKMTGFGQGIFNENELNGGLVTKDDKLNFFQKLKDYTAILVGHPIDVDPKAIAAGKEVDKTLVFIQKFVQGATSPKVPFADAAKQLGFDVPSAAPAAPAPTSTKTAPAAPSGPSPEELEKAEKAKKLAAQKAAKEKAEKEKAEKEKAEKEKEEKEKAEKARIAKEKAKKAAEDEAAAQRKKEEAEAEIVDESHPAGPSVNARKAPPKIRDAQNIVVEAAAPEIIKEDVDDAVDDVFDEEDAHKLGGGDGVDQGNLMKIIKESKNINQKANSNTASDIESYKAGINVAKELLQLLTKSASPLNQLIQYSQEDLGNMKNEYKRWTEECEKQEKALAKEKAITDQFIGELTSKLDSLDKDIQRQQLKLRSIKASAFLKETDMMKQFAQMCSQ